MKGEEIMECERRFQGLGALDDRTTHKQQEWRRNVERGSCKIIIIILNLKNKKRKRKLFG